MSRIQQLDPHVINRIAAGEVIERPASVVKELLENSVDAGATRIEIDIADGGMQLIRISDNGEGIHPDDLTLAVTSHATSKIRSDADLQRVATLGFRGEALASIASVSRFRIRTRTHEQTAGCELECIGGEITAEREIGCPRGTVIEVGHLFFNTPARRKFLKKGSTEFGHIVEQFTRVALPNPCLHLVLRHNENLVHELPASSGSLDRIRRFAGSEIADKLIAVESQHDLPEGGTIRLWGYVAEPSVSKSTRRSQYLFLNGRCIQDRSLQHALTESYRGLLMVGRHPVSYLFLEVPPALVDVNVHPTKTEVRFQDGQTLYRQLLKTIRDRFLALNFRTEVDLVPSATRRPLQLQATPALQQPVLDLWRNRDLPDAPPAIGPARSTTPIEPQRSTDDTARGMPSFLRGQSEVPEFQAFPDSGRLMRPAATSPGPVPCDATAAQHPPMADASPADHRQDEASPDDDAPHAILSSTDAAENATSAATVVTDEFRAFQIHDCYLVVATDAGLEVIDQHALHERILYEHLRRRILSGAVERQKLLIPQPVELSATDAAVLTEHLDLLNELGFELQEFGGTTMLLTAYPALIPRRGLETIVRELAEQLEQSDGRISRRDLLDHLLHTMACRAAIKAGQRLTQEEMRSLLRQRNFVDDAHHCPHGRPTSLTLSRGTLDQQFGRLG